MLKKLFSLIQFSKVYYIANKNYRFFKDFSANRQLSYFTYRTLYTKEIIRQVYA